MEDLKVLDLKQLQTKREALATQIRTNADKANDEKQDWTAEDAENDRQCNADYDAVLAEITAKSERKKVGERAKQITDQLEAERREKRKIGRDDFRGAFGGGQHSNEPVTEEHRALAVQAWMRAQEQIELTDEHREACELTGINPYARSLDMRIASRAPRTVREARDLSAITATAGGYTVPAGMLQPLEVALLAFGGMRQASEVIRTDSGNMLPFPTSDDTSNTGELIGENSSSSEQDVAFSVVNINAYKYSSKLIQVPVELLQDSAVNIPSFLGERMGERIARIQNTHFTTGDGASKPYGVITHSTLGVTTASASAITMDEVLDLIASVDPSYRPGGAFMARDATIIALRKLKDGMGRYLWSSGSVQDGTPDRLWDVPVVTNQDVAAIAASAKVLLYGQLSRYKIRDVQTIRIRRLVERYADTDQEGYIAFMRSDGALIDAGTHPVKYMAMHS